MLSIAVHTLGCKLNQLESESIIEAFRQEGFSLVSGETADIGPADLRPADMVVINTCTVTSKSEQKARRLIRKALQDNPRSCVIVTGCYAQLEAGAIAALEESGDQGRRLFVVAGDRKTLLLDLPRFLWDTLEAGLMDLRQALERFLALSEPASPQDGDSGRNPFRFNVKDFSFHSRPFLKIQDGCDHACAYCRVSLARGKSVSLDAETLLSRLTALEAAGHGEAVLTGVNLNQYQSSALDLPALLMYLLENTRTIALRLSSLEPDGMTEPFLRVLAHRRIRPHFHLSIQSGSPLILEKMRRRYSPGMVENAVRRLRSLRDDPFLAGDIIAGFPGEISGEFAKTYDLCRRAGFAWIHAFPYSKRPGTEAFSFKDAVPEREAVSRVESLIGLARQGKAAYIRRWTGKTVEAIVEGRQGTAPLTALSENYLKLLLPKPEVPGSLPPGTVLRCRIQGAADAVEIPGSHFDAIAEIRS